MPILQVENMTKSFGHTEVLKGINFSLEQGHVLVIIGSSGSGKTTLLRCLNFLEHPDTGIIRVNGNVLLDTDDPATQIEAEIRKKRLHFGLVFQSFNLFPQYTVLKNITLASELSRGERRLWKKSTDSKAAQQEIEAEARVLLEQMGLPEKADAYPHQLSGGQQQRVAIARALATNPTILLADEPTGALDQKTGKQVMNLFQELNDEGRTVIMITHDLSIAKHAKRIVNILDGILTEGGEEHD